MTSVVLDASAVIALLRDEPGAAEVAKVIDRAVISAVNLQEVAKELLLSVPRTRGDEPLNADRPDGTPPLPSVVARRQDREDRLRRVPGLLRALHLGPLEVLGHSEVLFVSDQALLSVPARRG